MPLALHASTPAFVSGNSGVTEPVTLTSASFTPPAGSLLYILIGNNGYISGGYNADVTAVTDNLGTHLTYTPIANYGDGSTSGGCKAYLFTAPVTTDGSTPMSVSVTFDGANGIYGFKVLVVTGADTTGATPGVGAKNSGRTTSGAFSQSYNSTRNNSWGWAFLADWNASGTPTVPAGEEVYDTVHLTGQDTHSLIDKTALTSTSGTSVTMSVTAPDGADVSWIYFEMLPAASGPSAPTVTSTAATKIGLTTVRLNGNVTSDGGDTVTERGVCWGDSASPTIAGAHQTASGTTGAFTVDVTGLVQTHTYYWRAYATNAQGTSYSTPSPATFVTQTEGPVTETITTTGDGTWTCPENVATVQVECWGGGGAGGGRTSQGCAGGGGGGAYAKGNAVAVTPGTSYSLHVAVQRTGGTGNGTAGDVSWFGSTATVYAAGGGGGGGGTTNTAGSGGAASPTSIGDVTYRGGNAAAGSGTSTSGAGGGGAGTSGNGGDASGTTAGTGTATGGGNGGAGRTTAGNGNTGSTYGGGGSGGWRSTSTNRNGGVGAAGRIVLNYTIAASSPPDITGTATSKTLPASASAGKLGFTSTATAAARPATSGAGALTFAGTATAVVSVGVSASGSHEQAAEPIPVIPGLAGGVLAGETLAGGPATVDAITGIATASVSASIAAGGSERFAGAGAISTKLATSAAALEIFKGSASTATSPLSSASGKEIFTGSSSALAVPATAAAGTLQIQGVGTSVAVARIAASGKETFAGAASSAALPVVAGSGAPRFTGTGAIAAITGSVAGSGRETFAGDATNSIKPTAAADGSLHFGGSATSRVTATHAASGKETFVGSASTAAGAVVLSATGTHDTSIPVIPGLAGGALAGETLAGGPPPEGPLFVSGSGACKAVPRTAASGSYTPRAITGTLADKATPAVSAAGALRFVAAGAVKAAVRTAASGIYTPRAITGTGMSTARPATASEAILGFSGAVISRTVPRIAAQGLQAAGVVGTLTTKVTPKIASTGVYTPLNISGTGSAKSAAGLAGSGTERFAGAGSTTTKVAVSSSGTLRLSVPGTASLQVKPGVAGAAVLKFIGSGAAQVYSAIASTAKQSISGAAAVHTDAQAAGSGKEIFVGTASVAATPGTTVEGTNFWGLEHDIFGGATVQLLASSTATGRIKLRGSKMIDTVDTYYSYVRTRMAEVNPARQMCGIINAQDWPLPDLNTTGGLYLLVLSFQPVGGTEANKLYEYLVQWTWVSAGSNISPDEVAKNRGDRYREAMAVIDDLLKANYPGFTQKKFYSVNSQGTLTSENTSVEIGPSVSEMITWSRPRMMPRQDTQNTGIIYGAADMRIRAYESVPALLA